MEILGMLIGWLASPFRDSLEDTGRNRYWEDPDFDLDEKTDTEEEA